MDLERLFRQIVLNLAARHPEGPYRPLTLADLRETIVPYRANRRALQIESSEDYELALLRLCSGENGLAHVAADEIQAEFAAEIRSPIPDLGVLERHQQALLHLDREAVARVLEFKPELRFAPRQSTTPKLEEKTPARSAKARSDSPRVEKPPQCSRCGGALPLGRVVNFCPQCGQNLARRHCPQCNTELEASWKHCVNCGVSLAKRAK